MRKEWEIRVWGRFIEGRIEGVGVGEGDEPRGRYQEGRKGKG